MTSHYEFENNDTFRVDKVTAKFICDDKNEPAYIYRYDEKKFEVRSFSKQEEIEYETSVKELQNLHDPPLNDDVLLQYAHDFYLDNKLYFLIVVKPADFFECFFYLLEYSNKKLSRFLFKRPVKGAITNIYVSRVLKNDSQGNYHIVTIGTLDSAIYVFRITGDTEKFGKQVNEAHRFNFALLRTDARNAITQQILELEHESKSPANVYLICGGFNGVLDFFLLKSNSNLDLEPDLQFIRHGIDKLPTNLPINSIQCFNLSSTHTVLAIGQALKGTHKRSYEPSMSLIKLSKTKLHGHPIVSSKYVSGTQVLPVITQENGKHIARSVNLDDDAVVVSDCPFDVEKFKFVQEDKTNRFFEKFTGEMQQIMVTSQCWALTRTDVTHLPIKDGNKRLKRKRDA